MFESKNLSMPGLESKPVLSSYIFYKCNVFSGMGIQNRDIVMTCKFKHIDRKLPF